MGDRQDSKALGAADGGHALFQHQETLGTKIHPLNRSRSTGTRWIRFFRRTRPLVGALTGILRVSARAMRAPSPAQGERVRLEEPPLRASVAAPDGQERINGKKSA